MTPPTRSDNADNQDPRASRGEWEVLPYNSQIETVHMALLHTGKVVYFSGFRIAEAVETETRLWYPKTGEIKTPPTPADLFCAGHSFLPDGRLLSTGGTLEYRNLPPVPPWLVRLLRPLTPLIVRLFAPIVERYAQLPSFTGPTFMYLFDPITEQWEFAGDMAEGRWYPTNTTLPDGRILILSGSNEGGGFGGNGAIETNLRVEVYSAEEGLKQVATLPGSAPVGEHDSNGEEPHAFISLYPRMLVLPVSEKEKSAYPAGKAFSAGYGPETRFLNLDTWDWTDVDRLKFGTRHDGCVVLLPLRPPDYRARVLTFGGIQDPATDPKATETTEIIDFGKSPHTWQYVDSMLDKRVNAFGVILPDGKILAVGGNSTGQFDKPVFNVEVFNPDEEKWTQVEAMSVPRGYHSTILLLPDGRVLSVGTTPYGNHELRMEVYSPYYLFDTDGTLRIRPEITKVSGNVSYGQPFDVTYEYAGTIKSAALIRPGAVTHSFDMEQRYVELRIDSQETGRLTVEAPRDEHIAPPGYYMLFILSEDGIPSEAEFVHLPVRSH